MNEVMHAAAPAGSTKCTKQGPNEGRTEVPEHVTCINCRDAAKIEAHGIGDWIGRLVDDLYVDAPPSRERVVLAILSGVEMGMVLEREPPTPPVRSHDLRFLQLNLPWTPSYSEDFRSNPQSHKDFAHAVLHIAKATGNLATVSEEWDHKRPAGQRPGTTLEAERAAATKALADLVICALRAASVLPGGSLDLARAVVERIETKNGVQLVEKK